MSGRNKQKFQLGQLIFFYYEESLVSSNLNSKQIRFHGAHPNLQIVVSKIRIMFTLHMHGQEKIT